MVGQEVEPQPQCPLVEDQLARIILTIGGDRRPRLAGKVDERGQPLLSPRAAFTVDHLAVVIGQRLSGLGLREQIAGRLEQLQAAQATESPLAKRLPYFCSGCPHNRSTVVPEGSRALAGIGCHYMAQWMDRDTTTFTQMGGEGASWIGQAPFTETPHVFVNLGDGTYAHSGLLAIRAAIAAGVTITYKLLYNDAVAMTGGQAAEGGFSVAQIARQLAAEGVGKIYIVAEEPERHRGTDLPSAVVIEPRDRLESAQRTLREIKGVSVLIYDQVCAAEKRRRRKRGQMPDAGKRVFINELVCEGCGDCGRKSNCVSIVPVETEFGRKRRIDQTSCNQDTTCVDGFCPSFVTIEGGMPAKRSVDAVAPASVATPVIDFNRAANIVVGGIGGTGIVTIGAIVGMAAHLDGRAASVMDQIGLAQKGGEVTSHVRISQRTATLGPIRLAPGEADTLIGCDIAVAALPEVVSLLAKDSVAVINDHVVMTGDFTGKPDASFPLEQLKRRLERAADVTYADLAGMAARRLGDAVGANMMALGMAWQKGRVPLTENAILGAIELNGAAIAMNKAAFAWGRALAADPAVGKEPDGVAVAETLEQIVDIRATELTSYQDEALAARYNKLVGSAAKAESLVSPGSTDFSKAVARSFFKLLAYKDEYEVARLHVTSGFLDKLKKNHSGGSPVFHMAPPLFARRDPVTGHLCKVRLGGWVFPLLKMLARLKVLRGTWADPFGYMEERRAERRAVEDYERLIGERIIPQLVVHNQTLAIEIASLPLSVRGYGHVKAEASDKAALRLAELLGRWPGDGVQQVAAE